METRELNLEQISGKQTVSREDGRVVCQKIKELWNNCERIKINFANLAIASVSFMDEAFGQLALQHSREELRKKLEFVNMSEYDRALLNDIIFSRIRQSTLDRKHASRKRPRRGVQLPRKHR